MAKRQHGNLALRLGSALVMIPLVLVGMFAAPSAFIALVIGFAVLSVREFYLIAEKKNAKPLKLWGYGVTVAMCLAATSGKDVYVYYALTGGILLIGTVLMTRNRPNGTMNFAASVLGLTYVGWFLANVILMLKLDADPRVDSYWDPGLGYVIFMLAIIMLGDSGAYFVGSAFGRHKLIPGISPNKTIEGAIGGLAFSMFGGLIVKEFQVLTGEHFRLGIFPLYSHAEYVYVAALCAGMGQVGDLVVSFIKRDVGIKDSGVFLPGHGGFLDRFDSLLYAAPVMYYYARYVSMP